MWEHLLSHEALDGWGFILKGRVNEFGYGSIATPRSLAAFDEALRRWGTRQLAELLEPAIAYCEDGWQVRPHVWSFWNEPAALGRDANVGIVTKLPASRKIYCKPDGSMLAVGDILRNPDMGRTLRRIAKNGIADFYEGEIAAEIVADMRANGGLITARDLATCAPDEHPPLWGTYRDHRIATNNPPGGGIMLIEMLNILECFALGDLEHNSAEYIRIVAEAMKRATIDKDRHVGDPRFVDVPVDRLTSLEYAAGLADEIRAGRKADVPRFNAGGAPSRDTTHVSVIDADGNCVTMTHSLGMPSGVITPGLGFMYNGCMGVFDPRPGKTGSLAPGKARFSSVVPSIVFEGDRPHIVIGAPGATQIAMGVLQVLLNAIDFGMTMVEAVSAPRFSATSNAVDVSNRIPRAVERDLEAQGYEVLRNPNTFGFAAVHGIRVHPDGLDGGADPGHDGIVLAV